MRSSEAFAIEECLFMDVYGVGRGTVVIMNVDF
jgi:hypothetical protein